MRTAIILVREHGKKVFEMVSGPEAAFAQQNADMREILAHPGTHEHFAEVQYWTSDGGLQRTVKFLSPEESEAREDKRKKDQAAHEAHLESLRNPPKAKPAQPAKAAESPASPKTPETPQAPASAPAATNNAPQAPSQTTTEKQGDW